MSNPVPEGWSKKPLHSLSERIRTPVDGDPKHVLTISSTSGWVDQRQKWARNMAGESLKKYTKLAKGEFSYNRGNSKTFPYGCVFKLDGWSEAAVPNVYHSFRVDPDKVDPDFLQHSFHGGCLDSQLRSIITSSARANGLLNITASEFFCVELAFPPLPEQQKIAAILSSLDDMIEKTRAQIDKLKDLKTGMMQELLTKGIGLGGVPHTEFKDSPVGRIPVGWDVKSLFEVSINHDSQRVPIKSVDRAAMSGAYRYYGASGIIDYVNNFIFDGSYILLGEDGENVLSRKLPLAFIVSGKFWVNNHAHVLTPKPGMDIGFLCEYLESLDYTNIASGSAQPKITQGALNQIQVPIPPLEEQSAIADSLRALDKKVAITSERLGRYLLAKKALMQDLLTGKVRVKVDSKESAVA